MNKSLLLVPMGRDVGLPTVSLGLQHAVAGRGIRIATLSPFSSGRQHAGETHTCMTLTELEDYLGRDAMDQAVDRVLQAHNALQQSYDTLLIHGLMAKQSSDYAHAVNQQLAQSLDCDIILVTAPGHHSAASLANHIEIINRSYQQAGCRVLGVIVNKIFAPFDQEDHAHLCINQYEHGKKSIEQFALQPNHTKVLAKILWQESLIAPRLSDVVQHIKVNIIHRGDMQRRVHSMRLCARGVNNMTTALQPNTLIITAGDRHDIILAVAMAALNGTEIAGLLLTGGFEMDPHIASLCAQALQTGLTILSISNDSFTTCQHLQNITLHTPADDHEKIQHTATTMATAIDHPWIDEWLAIEERHAMNQAAFRYHLVQQAKAHPRRIVLPEGDEPRTLQAALQCQTKGIAHITLLGDPQKINAQAKSLGIELPSEMRIIDPQTVYRDYIDDLIALRAHKGMNRPIAEEQLQDRIVLGTMMLQRREVDGLVSGAVHPTASVLRPALQLIKTAPSAAKVSSVFFMCFPNQVMIFGDCAVNPNPDEATLADIAIQSARTAERFGIDPKVAMISYSTGSSAGGEEVARVRAATELVRQKAPDIIIDGPLQYDAAIIPHVARQKAPNSKVAGHATVLIFPDLNTGNTTYKAVQRSAHLLCIGPMLQGLNQPVNDLSRGASVDDIIYTIALTARQAQ